MQYHWYVLKLVNGLCAEFACLPVVTASRLTLMIWYWGITRSSPQDWFRVVSGARLDRIGLQIWWSSTAWCDSELPWNENLIGSSNLQILIPVQYIYMYLSGVNILVVLVPDCVVC